MNNYTNRINKVFRYMVMIGCISNISSILLGLWGNDDVLILCAVLLIGATLIGYFLHAKSGNTFGIHLMLSTYVVVFTYAGFTHLAYLPLVIVFPIVVSLANLFFSNIKEKSIYYVSCMLLSLVTMYQSLQFNNSNGSNFDFYSSFLIGGALLFALIFITQLQASFNQQYQTRLKENEKAIKVKNKELNRYIESNLQLENFAHLASHELKTPMRNISNFAGLLNKKVANKLNTKEREIITHITKEVGQMNGLIADLLKLSNITNDNIEFKEIECLIFLHELVEEYFGPYASQILFENIPKIIVGNKGQLKQLFVNLLENAFKFNDNQNEAKVIISAESDNRRHKFTIHDNGIGIKDEYKDQIFLIFKRLHNQSEYPGTGIGLSICKKIAERHQGEISLERSQVLNGSAIKFDISKALQISEATVKRVPLKPKKVI